MPANKKEEARRYVDRLRGFYQQLTSYVVINAMLAIINLISNPHHLWFYWVSLFWGVALIIQAIQLYGPGGKHNSSWEAKKMKEYMDKHQDE